MDDARFDALAKTLAAGPTRRGALRLLAGAALGGALALLGVGEAGADHGCRHRGERCREDRQCCSGKCRDGECARCREGRTACGGACVDTDTNLAHCGGCDQPCDQACVGGECVECKGDGDCPAPEGGGATCRADGSCAQACDAAAFRVCGEAPGACRACCEDGHCATGQRCDGGACVCDHQSCPNGCCAGERCEAGTADGACGRGGVTCRPCGTNARCVDGTCACDADFHACGDECVAQDDPAHCPRGWELAFGDEFDGAELDAGRWLTKLPSGRDRSYAGELQWYAEDAFEVADGRLRIVADRCSMPTGHEYCSGLVSSQASFAQEYGYFEIRARVPAGQGLWPAFWLLPNRKEWPPEIDVFEILGHRPDKVYMTVHYRDAEGAHRYITHRFYGPDFSQDYHTFAVAWGPTGIVWYVDGVERHRVEQVEAIPSGPLFVVTNLAVGGPWPGNPDETTPFPAFFDVDHIRVYRKVQA